MVLSVGASLIATLGLLSNSAAVVIGAMVVAPWITPLRTAAFAILQGRLRLFGQAALTLAVGTLLTIAVSAALGLLTGPELFGTEVRSRTEPNLLDLGIALVAGAVATYAKVRSEAVSSLAGTAIAVALVPPVCVLGLTLSASEWPAALGAGLLFATNLLGILSGGLVVLAASAPDFSRRLSRSSLSWVSFLLTGLLVLPLGGSFIDLMGKARHTAAQQRIEATVGELIAGRKELLGNGSTLADLSIDWNQNPPLLRVLLRVSNPNVPTPRQVARAQELINENQPIRFRLVVQRSAVELIGPQTAPNPEEKGRVVVPEPPAAPPPPTQTPPPAPLAAPTPIPVPPPPPQAPLAP
ncbi:MAG: DUF389 domain-containing protein [Prochlorococcaceae cyanobacterium]